MAEADIVVAHIPRQRLITRYPLDETRNIFRTPALKYFAFRSRFTGRIISTSATQNEHRSVGLRRRPNYRLRAATTDLPVFNERPRQLPTDGHSRARDIYVDASVARACTFARADGSPNFRLLFRKLILFTECFRLPETSEHSLKRERIIRIRNRASHGHDKILHVFIESFPSVYLDYYTPSPPEPRNPTAPRKPSRTPFYLHGRTFPIRIKCKIAGEARLPRFVQNTT